MTQLSLASASVTLAASPAKVWDALTNPELIKQYLFGTNVTTDWKEGSPIVYKGTWEGKEYEDKGTILKVIPEKLLVNTYWSNMSGTEDLPENYMTITYDLTSQGEQTVLTITQDNNQSEEARQHSENNWKSVLEGLKKVVES